MIPRIGNARKQTTHLRTTPQISPEVRFRRKNNVIPQVLKTTQYGHINWPKRLKTTSSITISRNKTSKHNSMFTALGGTRKNILRAGIMQQTELAAYTLLCPRRTRAKHTVIPSTSENTMSCHSLYRFSAGKIGDSVSVTERPEALYRCSLYYTNDT
jgi:surface antigen